MIAAIPHVHPTMPPCPIRWVGRKGLGVKAQTYCGREAGVTDGVLQLPDTAKICEGCKAKIAEAKP